MKIAVIGAGAMGSVYGGHLSLYNEVLLVDTNSELVKTINEKGLTLIENGQENRYYPAAVTDTENSECVDLVILFVKALYSRSALLGNRSLIGDKTYILTLQNGSGHEDILREFVAEDHIIIGTTEDNGAIKGMGVVAHGGEGRTNIGMLPGQELSVLEEIKEVFDRCGFQTRIHENIQYLIWHKLFTNVSLSAVTAALQVKMGFIAENQSAWELTCRLIHEAWSVAEKMDLHFEEADIVEEVCRTSRNNPEGMTSICADILNHRKTEVDTISGSVVRAAAKYHVAVPTHETIVTMIHALEARE